MSIPTACKHCGNDILMAHAHSTHNREQRSTLVCIACNREAGVLIGAAEHDAYRAMSRRLSEAAFAAAMATLDAGQRAAAERRAA